MSIATHIQRFQPVPSLPLLKGQPGALARDSGEIPRQPSAAIGLEYIPWVCRIQLTKRPVYNLSGAQQWNIMSTPPKNQTPAQLIGYNKFYITMDDG